MKFRYIKSILSAASLLLAVSVTSCIGDLDATPIDPNIVMTFDQASVFNKIYGTLGLTGQKGPDGSGDLDDIDEGTSSFYRMTWCANQLMTDEAIVNSWNDAGVATIADCSWSSSNEIVTGLYYRLTFDITLCNYFLEQTEGLTDDETTRQRAEVRFIRALNNYYLMDMFGNPPYCDKVSTEKPQQIQRADLFAKIEEELKEIGDDATATLAQPLQTTYGRVDRVAAWLLLARMYLNAEVYTGTPQWGKAKEYAQKVIGSSYKLAPVYKHLFMADNDGSNVNKARQEVILPILQDGVRTKSWGGSLFLIAGTHKSDTGMNPWGSKQGWGGPHCRQAMVAKFFPNVNDAPSVLEDQMVVAAKDDRALMCGVQRSTSTGDNMSFTDGFACAKFSNIRADNGLTSDTDNPDMDIPLLRMAEAYLIVAEASIRANNGVSTQETIDAMHEIRKRANAAESDSYTLTDIRDEWAREFWFEGRRRIDLIRFGDFGGHTDYNWDWKGGEKQGTEIKEFRNIYPIPANDINANTNLDQNPEY